jgi:DNA-directed RNA polymerase subunit RPC12/RpoP/ribosomal protein L40E
MAEIKLIAAICPRCGANLELPSDLKTAHCVYCGTEILLAKTGVSHKVECKMCDGFGRLDICPVCNGRGDCKWSSSYTGGRNDITMLSFSAHCDKGVCSACGGSGRYFLAVCAGCGGVGRCPQCLGTGKCAACRGIGIIPNPRGADKCQACEGTGLVDIEAHADPLAGRCPDCKRVSQGDRRDCWYCGFRKNLCPKCGATWVTGLLYCRRCGYTPDSEKKTTS